MSELPEAPDSSRDADGPAIDLAGVLNKLQRELDLANGDDECAFDLLFGLDH